MLAIASAILRNGRLVAVAILACAAAASSGRAEGPPLAAGAHP